jgi:hypothetical protein
MVAALTRLAKHDCKQAIFVPGGADGMKVAKREEIRCALKIQNRG